MPSYQEFEKQLYTLLCHLYDPAYQPDEALCIVMGCDPGEGMPAVQSVVLQALERLRPPASTPATAPAKQAYDLLHHRFVLRLTQEETAYRLNVSRRTVNRLQHRAAHALAGALWRHSQAVEQMVTGLSQVDDALPLVEPLADTQDVDWQVQMQRELDSLQAKAPNAWCDIQEVIDSVLEFTEPMASGLGIRLNVRSVQPGLVAAIHPVLLHQVMISALRRFAPCVTDGQISVYARLEDGNARITLTGSTAAADVVDEQALTSGIPMSKGISIETCLDGAQAFVWISIPSVGKVTVLVVDDNEDMARFYRDCTLGTRYHITHIAQGGSLFESIETVDPDVIVLDVMLPDIDGWRLLMRLHEDPATRSIPVIICSVVQEKDLALSLGAAGYLSKPMKPREFIAVLDQALLPVPADSWRSRESSRQVC